MKRYCIKCEADRVEFLDILRETDTGFVTRVVRVRDDYERVVEEFMPQELFQLCLKTGYIYEMKATSVTVA